MKKVLIVIPAHNEEKRIGQTLGEYLTFLKNLQNNKFDYEIIVVINNSNDKTEEIVKNFSRKDSRLRYLNLKQKGKGFAVIMGFIEAIKLKGDLIGFVDADMATSPEEYYKLIKEINGFDGAIADRYLKDSKVFPPATFRRLIVGRAFNFLVRALLFIPYKDTQCGAKIFKREALEKTISSLSMSQWAFDVELLYQLRKNGLRIKSVATKWIDREYSKINFLKAGPWMALGVIRLRILNSPIKKFIRLYDTMLGFVPK